MQDKLTIGIIGAGTMGRGIAQVAAENNNSVLLFDSYSNASSSAIEFIKSNLQKKMEKKKVEEQQANQIINNISTVDELSKLSDCKLIIEAAAESSEIKKNIFNELSNIVQDDCILATNTSSLSITSIASAAAKPGRVIGIHFFNPAPVMPLVEVIPGLLTSENTVKCSQDIISKFGKTVVIAKDTPGFIVNRVARPFYGEALRIYEEGIAEPSEIDWAMKEFGGFKMGPFELMDLIGNDINFAVTESIFSATFYSPKYRPSIIQKRMIEANLLGRKTGKGFYEYSGKENPEPNKDLKTGAEIFYRILVMLINEAADTVLYNIASVDDIDLAMTKGVNYPKGLLMWADELELDKVLSRLQDLYSEYGEERYRPSPLIKRMVLNGEKFYGRKVNSD